MEMVVLFMLSSAWCYAEVAAAAVAAGPHLTGSAENVVVVLAKSSPEKGNLPGMTPRAVTGRGGGGSGGEGGVWAAVRARNMSAVSARTLHAFSSMSTIDSSPVTKLMKVKEVSKNSYHSAVSDLKGSQPAEQNLAGGGRGQWQPYSPTEEPPSHVERNAGHPSTTPAPTTSLPSITEAQHEVLSQLHNALQGFFRSIVPALPPPSPSPAPPDYSRMPHGGRRHDDQQLMDNEIDPKRPDSMLMTPWYEEVIRASLRVLVKCRRSLPSDDADETEATNHSLFDKMRGCLHKRLLTALDRLIDSDEIPLAEGVQLVRRFNPRQSREDPRIMTNDFEEEDDDDSDDPDRPLMPRVLSRLGRLMRSHDLHLSFKQAIEEGRRRHQYRKVFPILVTGFMILMSLMVPLGFQFMAMIGGKALLMSKMALIMASVHNFRRYSAPPAHSYTNIHHSPPIPQIVTDPHHLGPYHEH